MRLLRTRRRLLLCGLSRCDCLSEVLRSRRCDLRIGWPIGRCHLGDRWADLGEHHRGGRRLHGDEPRRHVHRIPGGVSRGLTLMGSSDTMSFSRSSKPQRKGVKAPTSIDVQLVRVVNTNKSIPGAHPLHATIRTSSG